MATRLAWGDGPGLAGPSITPREFRLLAQVVEREAGIHLGEHKVALLAGRLAGRVRELGLRSFLEYHDLVSQERSPELVHLLDRITTNETHFFREPTHFRYIMDELVPRWCAEAAHGGRSRRLKVWSAGCSTGEEPYSLAMVLHHALVEPHGWTVEVLGSDLSTRALGVAEGGVWPGRRLDELPIPFMRRYFLRGRGAQAGRVAIHPMLRAMVRFARINLAVPPYAARGPFDMVFCRNTLIYFDRAMKQRVVAALVERVAPGGRLFVGHAESLNGISPGMRMVRPSVYEREE